MSARQDEVPLSASRESRSSDNILQYNDVLRRYSTYPRSAAWIIMWPKHIQAWRPSTSEYISVMQATRDLRLHLRDLRRAKSTHQSLSPYYV